MFPLASLVLAVNREGPLSSGRLERGQVGRLRQLRTDTRPVHLKLDAFHVLEYLGRYRKRS